jgi:hypothetical protein
MAYNFLYIIFGLESVRHSFDYVAHFVFLRDVWIRTQRAAISIMRATNIASHLPKLATHLHILPPISHLAKPSPCIVTHIPT